MPTRGLVESRRELLLLAGLHTALLALWGQPELLHDEADYIAQGTLLRASVLGDAPLPEALGRLTLHNPAYAGFVALLEAPTGIGASLTRLLQCAAGILSGLLLRSWLQPRVGGTAANMAAWLLWLHPTLLFFRLTLWPVSFTLLGLCLFLHQGGLLGRDEDNVSPPSDDRVADSRNRQTKTRRLGWLLALLPLLTPSALLLWPIVVSSHGLAKAAKILRFGVVLIVGWSVLLSVAVGTPAFLDLSGPRNVSLANHPAISEGRGSLWGDPSAKASWSAELAAACPGESGAAAKRCELQWARSNATQTILNDPTGALHRAILRVAETWAPDRFLPRHLEGLRGSPTAGIQGALALLHGVLVLMALLGLRHPLGRRLLLASLLWTLPVLLAVGFTRLRIPLTPWLLASAALGLAGLRTPRR